VNQSPTFTRGPDIATYDNAGPHDFSPWATHISAGAGDPPGQTLTFELTVDRPELFAEMPRVDVNGRLTFTPAINTFGLTAVTVVLSDNGGTVGGGSDRSTPQIFFIHINKDHIWRNSIQAEDVTADGNVVAGDVVEIINHINAFGPHALTSEAFFGAPFYDVDGNDFISAADALAVINWINAFGGGAGEGKSSPGGADDRLADVIAVLCSDSSEQSARRLKRGNGTRI
jgi:hypothetical protein